LKAVENEDCRLEFDGIDGAVCPLRIVFDNLEHAGARESFEYFGSVVLLANLCKVKSMTEKLSHGNWKLQQIFLAAPDPDDRLLKFAHIDHT
jgi:hypothetical protein